MEGDRSDKESVDSSDNQKPDPLHGNQLLSILSGRYPLTDVQLNRVSSLVQQLKKSTGEDLYDIIGGIVFGEGQRDEEIGHLKLQLQHQRKELNKQAEKLNKQAEELNKQAKEIEQLKLQLQGITGGLNKKT